MGHHIYFHLTFISIMSLNKDYEMRKVTVEKNLATTNPNAGFACPYPAAWRSHIMVTSHATIRVPAIADYTRKSTAPVSSQQCCAQP